VHLGSLTQLHTITLTGTHVTDDGIRKLQKALPEAKIYH
jgi:hypothetical protein